MSQDYRPSAFWFWNGNMDYDGIRETVEDIAKADIREFLIHPVHGMDVEYLSEEFFDLYRYALTLAKQHGMKVWVYDEFGWPSGNAGGILLRDHPEYLGWYLHFEAGDDGIARAEITQSDRILDNTMGAGWTRSERGYLNTMNPDAVRGFIDSTYQRIYDECPGLFQDVIAGFFTDEPVCWMGKFNGSAGGWQMAGLPWTPELPKRFLDMFGYSIEDKYDLLADSSQVQLKADYWQIAEQMHTEAYHAQLGKWCREHGVKYTGHLGEDTPLMQVRFAGSAFQALKEMDEPGIDFLGHGGGYPDERFVDHVMIPSIARHTGKDRVYCEAFGITGQDIRLGEMLKRMQMFGIYGINDVALMGFQQTQRGIRKLTYWPSIFTDSTWWQFYPEFRDASARSISIANLGTPKHKYALLYPQFILEQENVLNTQIGSFEDPGSRLIKQLGLAVYESRETFEYIYPEILFEAVVENGKVKFPNAEYGVILAPVDANKPASVQNEIERLKKAGAVVYEGTLEEVIEQIGCNEPEWIGKVKIESLQDNSQIRVFRYDYEDGELYVVRNISDSKCQVRIDSDVCLTIWDPVDGAIHSAGSGEMCDVEPHATLYISTTAASIAQPKIDRPFDTRPVDVQWEVDYSQCNTARLSDIKFKHPRKGWLDAVDCSVTRSTRGRSPVQMPVDFRGYCAVDFCCSFTCDAVPEKFGFVYESGYIAKIEVNGNPVDLNSAEYTHIWDKSNLFIDIKTYALPGENTIVGTLSFPTWESMVENDAFLWHDLMPGLDACLAGSFRLVDGVLLKDDGNSKYTLPLNLGDQGWSEYYGTIILRAELDIEDDIKGIIFEGVSEDCMELKIDGRSVGRKIICPYVFEFDGLPEGRHVVELSVTGTAASLLGDPSPWGLISASWIIQKSL